MDTITNNISTSEIIAELALVDKQIAALQTHKAQLMTCYDIHRRRYIELRLLDKRILGILFIDGSKTRRQLVQIFKKPRSTIYDALTRLITANWIMKMPKLNGKLGRPKVYYKIIRLSR